LWKPAISLWEVAFQLWEAAISLWKVALKAVETQTRGIHKFAAVSTSLMKFSGAPSLIWNTDTESRVQLVTRILRTATFVPGEFTAAD
jgi:hypothetical protein